MYQINFQFSIYFILSYNASMLFRRGFASLRSQLLLKQSRRGLSQKRPEILNHPEIAGTTKEEGAEYLGLYVGRYSEWRAEGLPWKLYRPLTGRGVLGREISKMEALERISNNQPVKFQRCRIVTVVPDINAVESAAIKRVSQFSTTRTAPIAADPQGFEILNGMPTMISSLPELKLFTAIHFQEIKLPEPLSVTDGDGFEEKKNMRIINEQIEIAHNISALLSRRLESCVDFYASETRFFRKMFFHSYRQIVFWVPTSLVAAYVLSSSYFMSRAGLEPWFLLPPTIMQEISVFLHDLLFNHSIEVIEYPDIPFTESSLGFCLAAVSVYIPSRCVWLSLFNPLGIHLTVYETFCRMTRGEPSVFQELQIHTFRIPFLTTLSWFTHYRPGDIIDTPCKLVKYKNMQLAKVSDFIESASEGELADAATSQ